MDVEDPKTVSPTKCESQDSDSMLSGEGEEPLSPIVGYIFDGPDDSPTSSSSDTDEDTRKLLDEMNKKFLSDKPLYQSDHRDPWKKLRKKRRKIFANLHSQNKKSKQQSSSSTTTPTKPSEPMETDDNFMSSDDSVFRMAASKLLSFDENGEEIEKLNIPRKDNIDSLLKENCPQVNLKITTSMSQSRLQDVDNVGPSSSIIFETDSDNNEPNRENCSTKIESEPPFVGFKTASGKSVSISKSALEKAKALMDTVDKSEHDTDIVPSCSKSAKSKPLSSFSSSTITREKVVCSSTENNDLCSSFKKVSDSPQPMVQSSVLLSSSADKQNLINVQSSMDVDDTNKCMGFQTASGKKVTVSKEAMLKAKSLLADTESTFEVPESDVKTPSAPSAFKSVRKSLPVLLKKSPVKRKSISRGFKPPFRGPVVDRAALRNKSAETATTSASAAFVAGPLQSNFVSGGDKAEGMTQEVQESIMALLEDDDDEPWT